MNENCAIWFSMELYTNRSLKTHFQVTTLVNTKPSNKKKGRSKKAHVLVAAVSKATEKFMEKGEEIASETPEIKNEMLTAVDEVRKTGKTRTL